MPWGKKERVGEIPPLRGSELLPVVPEIVATATTPAPAVRTVSVFVESFDHARHARPMSHDAFSMGATRMQMQRVGDWWLTAVGEVPQSTLQQLALSFERKK